MSSKHRKIYERIRRGQSDANVPLRHVTGLLKALGFASRVKGSHHIFTREGVAISLCLQDAGGGNCKDYQVRQVRKLLETISTEEFTSLR